MEMQLGEGVERCVCVMQLHATEAECVDSLMMIAWVSADVCHWVISCPGGPSGAGRRSSHMRRGRLLALPSGGGST